MNLHDILVQSADAALSLQNSEKGSMPAGHNGSYHDPETPVRNTAHWLITFLKAYSISGEAKFLEAAKKAVTYLCSDTARPMGATFWHRKKPEKDTCNGLIGQAWTIEALAVAAQGLERPELIALAEKVFLLHPQNPDSGVWKRVSTDGSHLTIDYTFNHQLWFAASGGLIAKFSQSKDIDIRVRHFLNQLDNIFNIYPSGLIKHLMPPKLFPTGKRAEYTLKQLRKIKHPRNTAKDRKYFKQKQVGYHSFNLYAFALLKREYPDHRFWKSRKFLRALKYIKSERYSIEVALSDYGYPYNPPGFEVPFALEIFCSEDQTRTQQSNWASKQLKICYDFETSLMNKNANDSMTHAARIYEATRLTNLPIDIGLF